MTLAEWKALSDTERAAINAEGSALGVHDCPVCGDSQLRKPFHDTTVSVGEQVGASVKIRVGDDFLPTRPAKFRGSRGITVLCEECWGELKPAERLPHYEGRFTPRRETIPSVTRRLIDRMLQDDPDDLTRHRADHAALDTEWEAIEKAVLAGA